MKFSSKLECVSKYSLKTIVLFQACSLLSVVADNSTYLAKIAGFNFNFAYAFLLLCNFIKFSVSIILAIPVLSPRLTTVFYVILASVLTIEAMIALASDDQYARTTAVLLAITASKHAVGAACSKRFRMLLNGVGETPLTDRISYKLRSRAIRYRLAPTSILLISGVVIYTTLHSENPFSRKSQLSRILGRAAYTRAAAAISLCAAVGAEDKTYETGRKKDF